MKVTTIRYKIAPDRVEENIGLVRAVFSKLHELSPQGLHYACVTADDGSFMHIVRVDDNVQDDVLTSLPVFQYFRSGLKDRTIEGSTFTDFEVVGSYGMF